MAEKGSQSGGAAAGRWFATTHWSAVLAAGDTASPVAADALGELCRVYWYPIYAFIRQQGRTPHDAQDLTQGFFAQLLKTNFLKNVAPHKGKFRSFLLASVKHFLANEWDRKQAVKRGAGYQFVSWDEAQGERRFGAEPAHELTADKIFDRRWALTLLETVFDELRREYVAAGKGPLFKVLEPYLSAPTPRHGYADEARQLELSAGAVKVAVHRLRRRYGQLLRAQIARTVDDSERVEEELRILRAAMRR